jgi:hypothetical protein
MPRKTLQKRVHARIIQIAGGGGDLLEARCGNCGRHLLVFRVMDAPAGLFWHPVHLRIGPGGAVQVCSFLELSQRPGWHTFIGGWGHHWDAVDRIWRMTPEARRRQERLARDIKQVTGATRDTLRETYRLNALHRQVKETRIEAVIVRRPSADESHLLPTNWECNRCGAKNIIAEANSPCI